MARLIRIYGLISVVLVDDCEETNDLLEHPALERSLEMSGPYINRLLLQLARRQFITSDGQTIRSMRVRSDGDRRRGQAALFEHLDNLATKQPWDMAAIQLMADYVATGNARDRALTALTYVGALPFPKSGATAQFEEQECEKLYRHFLTLRRARSPLSPRGFLSRLFGFDRRARQALLEHFDGNDYGLHAIMVTLDNAIEILDGLRKRTVHESELAPRRTVPLRWLTIRTAPQRVLRQVRETFSLPHVARRVPANTLVIFNMRNSLAGRPPAGYEFASGQWSACPARRYLMSLFEVVSDAASKSPVRGVAA